MKRPENKEHIAIINKKNEKCRTPDEWAKFGYNKACVDWEEYDEQLLRDLENLLSIAEDLLTWCIEPDKKFVYEDKIRVIRERLGVKSQNNKGE